MYYIIPPIPGNSKLSSKSKIALPHSKSDLKMNRHKFPKCFSQGQIRF